MTICFSTKVKMTARIFFLLCFLTTALWILYFLATTAKEVAPVISTTDSALEWCDKNLSLIGEKKIDIKQPPLDWSALESKFGFLTAGGHYKPHGTA